MGLDLVVALNGLGVGRRGVALVVVGVGGTSRRRRGVVVVAVVGGSAVVWLRVRGRLGLGLRAGLGLRLLHKDVGDVGALAVLRHGFVLV